MNESADTHDKAVEERRDANLKDFQRIDHLMDDELDQEVKRMLELD